MDFIRNNLKTIIYVIAGLILAVVVAVNFQKIRKFLLEAYSELKKVSWSSRQELIASTVLVIVITAIMTLFIWIVDLILSAGLKILFK